MSTESVGHPPPGLATSQSLVSRWFGLLGGHVAWSIQLMVCYALVDEACPDESTGYTLLVLAVTLAMLAVTVLSGWAAWKTYRRGADAEDSQPARRERFLGRVGLLLAGIYFFTLVLSAAFLVALPTCP